MARHILVGGRFSKGSGNYSDRYEVFYAEQFPRLKDKGFGINVAEPAECSPAMFEHLAKLPPLSVVELHLSTDKAFGKEVKIVRGVDAFGTIADYKLSETGLEFIKAAK